MTAARRLVLGSLLALASLVLGAAAASAYWTSTGTGTGTATTATLDAPTNVVGTYTAGASSVALTWNAPTAGVTPLGYAVTRVTQPGGVTAPACGGGSVPGSGCTDSGLPAGTYTWVVAAVYNSWTTASAPSPAVSVVLDITAPTVASVTSPTPDGSYRAGDEIAVTVTFGEPVVVTGTPTLTLATGNPATTPVGYTSGSGTSTLTFVYTVAALHSSADLTYTATTSLALAGGTIRDAAGNDAILGLPAIGAPTSLSGSKALAIDTAAPTVTSIVRAGASQTVNGGPLSWTITFAEPVGGVTAGTFGLALAGGIGGPMPTISAVSPTGVAPSATWTATVSTVGATGADGATIGLNLTSPAGIADAAGNALGTITATGQVYGYDTTIPAASITTVNGASAAFPYATTGNVTVIGGACTTADGGVDIRVTGATTLTTTASCTASAWSLTLAPNWTTVGTRTVTASQTDAAGNVGTDVETIVIDRTAPTVSGVSSSSADGRYGVGAVIAVTVTFSEPVVVSGTPQLALATGSPATTAIAYVSGSGTATLTFSYTVAANNASADLNYAATTSLGLNGGTIRDAAGNNATLTLPATTAPTSLGGSKALVIDTVAPTVSGVSSPTANGRYGVGTQIPITVTFNEAVTVTGTPTLTLATGTPATTAIPYTAGSGTTVLTFTYTVAAGNTSADLNYASTTSLGPVGSIRDIAGNTAALTLPATGNGSSLGGGKALVIDTTAPTVTSVTSSTANGRYRAGQAIAVTVTFTEAVTVTGTPQLTLATGPPTGTPVNYTSGSGTTALTFTYTVAAGQDSPDLDYLAMTSLATSGGTIRDAAGNDATLTLPAPGAAGSLGANKALVIDTTAPVVAVTRVNGSPVGFPYATSASVTSVGGTCTTGDGNVTVLVNEVSAGTATCTSSAWVLTTSWTTTATRSVSATQTDTAGNVGTAPAQTVTVDTAGPIVTSVSSTLPDGAYKAGASIPITVTFDEPAMVTGTPTLALATGTPASTTVANTGGSGTATLSFTYTVVPGNTAADLDYVATTSLALAGGSIRDAVGNPATLTLPTPGTANALAGNRNLVIDTTAPTITGVSSTQPDATYGADTQIPVTVTFSEPVTVAGAPQLSLATGSPATTAVDHTSGSGTNTLTFTYTVAPGNTAADLDYASTTSLGLNGGSIRDAAGNDATLTLPAPGTAASLGGSRALVIDTTAPVVTITGMTRMFFIIWRNVRVSGTAEPGSGPVTVYLCYNAGPPCDASNATQTFTGVTVSATGTWQTPWSDQGNAGTWYATAGQADAAGNIGTSPLFGPYSN